MNKDNWAAQIKAYADLKQFAGAVRPSTDVATMAILDATTEIRKQIG